MDDETGPDPAKDLLELELERSLRQRSADDDEERERIDREALDAARQVAERNHLLTQTQEQADDP